MFYELPVIRNWSELIMLRDGSETQRAVYTAIHDSQLSTLLRGYHPVLIGDAALGLECPNRLIKVVCQSGDLSLFIEEMRKHFWDRPQGQFEVKSVCGTPTAICQFGVYRFTLRISSQQTQVTNQLGFRAFQAQARLLESCTPQHRSRLEKLRQTGMKLDVAFGEVFKLGDDPRRLLSRMYDYEDERLIGIARGQKPIARKEPTRTKTRTRLNPLKGTVKIASSQSPAAFKATTKKIRSPALYGNFQHYIRLGIWGWLVQKKNETLLRITPEIKHEFDNPGVVLRVLYMKKGSLREALVQVSMSCDPRARLQNPEAVATDGITLQVESKHKVELGEYPVVAVWVRRHRHADRAAS